MGYQDYVLVLFFFYRYNIYSQAFFSKWICFHGQYFSRIFPDFVEFQDLSRTWKMNLLFSKFWKFSRNPVYFCLPRPMSILIDLLSHHPRSSIFSAHSDWFSSLFCSLYMFAIVIACMLLQSCFVHGDNRKFMGK